MSSISLISYATGLPGKVFVKDPSLRGRWMVTDISVIKIACPQCKALVGEPCYRYVQGRKSYSNGAHYIRRDGAKYNLQPKPKLRLSIEDML